MGKRKMRGIVYIRTYKGSESKGESSPRHEMNIMERRFIQRGIQCTGWYTNKFHAEKCTQIVKPEDLYKYRNCAVSKQR
jgi:hypothetical protein